jgi:hypothetical protein
MPEAVRLVERNFDPKKLCPPEPVHLDIFEIAW